jgi:hypothetical protein
LSSILVIRFDMVRGFLMLRLFLQRCCCTAIARSSGRVLAHCVLTSVGWGSPDVRQLLVLAAGLAATTATRAAAVAARAATIAAAAAAAAAAIAR